MLDWVENAPQEIPPEAQPFFIDRVFDCLFGGFGALFQVPVEVPDTKPTPPMCKVREQELLNQYYEGLGQKRKVGPIKLDKIKG